METELSQQSDPSLAKFAGTSAFVAIAGIADAVYLTVSHYTAAAVPCSITGGCETVLSSNYAELFGFPLALYGALAYFAAFSLAVLTAFGRHQLWKLFGILSFFMAAFSIWLIYVQAFILRAFCQFCLFSAATSLLLFFIWAAYLFYRRK
jgi:uncharacterized membrane protein